MRALLLALPLVAGAVTARAQITEGPDQADPMTCAAYTAMDDGGRIAALQGIEPFGDDIGAADEQAARDWADEVGRQCDGHPDLPLSEAANAANTSLEGPAE